MKIVCKHCGAVHEVDFKVSKCMACGKRFTDDKPNDIIEFLDNLEQPKTAEAVA